MTCQGDGRYFGAVCPTCHGRGYRVLPRMVLEDAIKEHQIEAGKTLAQAGVKEDQLFETYQAEVLRYLYTWGWWKRSDGA